jgi:hypothetical protein
MNKIDGSPGGDGARSWATRRICAGIHLTLADMAVGCALGYLDFRFRVARLAQPPTPTWAACWTN